MSKINNQTQSNSGLQLSSGGTHEKWRLIKDAIARYGVIAGGLGIIFAIALIFFYLLKDLKITDSDSRPQVIFYF